MKHLRFARLRRFRRDQRGAAMVEFAIIAPLLFALLFGIVDYGRLFFLYNKLTNAVREGARIGAVSGMTSAQQAAILSTVRSRVNDRDSLATGLTITLTPLNNGVRTVQVVWAGYPFRPVTFLVLRGNRTLTVKSEFRYEQ
jgi:Flp pilus assembly protein TadG